jgi:hypothetical protein
MKPGMALLLASLLLAGCASTTWYRPGASSDDLLVAMTTCRSTARIASVEVQPTISGEARLILPDREFDGVVFDRCMRDRGYVRTVTY